MTRVQEMKLIAESSERARLALQSQLEAQRLRADTAEAESEDLRRRVTNVNSQLIAANWELSETREAYLNQSGRLVGAEQRIAELLVMLRQAWVDECVSATDCRKIDAALNQKSEGN